MWTFRLIIFGIFGASTIQACSSSWSPNVALGLNDGDLGKAFLVRLTLRGNTCTASIIGDNWLLTAGHCIDDLFITGDKYDITRKTKYGDLKVYMTDAPYDEESFAAEKVTLLPLEFDADWTRPLTNKPLNANATNKPKKYWRRIESIIMHNKYTTESLTWQGYDIALIHLEPNNGKEVPDGKMLPACLPSKGFDDENNHTLFAAGYGWRRYPHCLTNMEGPEKFQTCGREFECTKEHRSRYCPMNFTDQEGSWHNSCITDSPTPSASSNECQYFHARRPDLKNTTVHLFSLDGIYERTCYALFSNNNGQKGWCTTRKPGVFVNKPPTEESGWGYCSNDTSLEMCGEEDLQSKEDDTPFSVSFLPHKNCFQELKENLAVEQPQEVANHSWFKKMVDDSDTFCVGQFLQHSFENEKFVFFKNGVYHDYANYDYLKPQIYSKSKAQQTYFDGGPGCFGDSGGPLWREVYDEKSGKKVPVIVGVFSFLLWGTCHGAQSPKYYGKVAPITDWIKQYVPENQICEYSKDLKDTRPATPLECKTGEWGEWIADFGLANIITNPKKSNLGNTDIENTDIENITWVEYGYDDYDNYTSEPYEYEYDINSFDFPPVVTNCSCARNNTEYEKQTRRIKIINEGSIGGTPCVNTSQTRDCKCPDWVVPTCLGQKPKCCKPSFYEGFCVAEIIRKDCPIFCRNYTTSTETPLFSQTTDEVDNPFTLSTSVQSNKTSLQQREQRHLDELSTTFQEIPSDDDK